MDFLMILSISRGTAHCPKAKQIPASHYRKREFALASARILPKRKLTVQEPMNQYTSTPSTTTFSLSVGMLFLLDHRVVPVAGPLGFSSKPFTSTVETVTV